MTDERLIVALDFHNMDDVKKLVDELGDSVNFYKVGMELFYSVGAELSNGLKLATKKFSSTSSSTTSLTQLRAVCVR